MNTALSDIELNYSIRNRKPEWRLDMHPLTATSRSRLLETEPKLRKTLSLVVLSICAQNFVLSLALCQSSTSASIDRITWHRPESRLRHNPPRQTSRHTTNISRRIRNADYTPTARRHFTRTATLNRRMPRFRDIYRHAARGQSQPSVIYCLPWSSSARPSVAPSDAPSNRWQLTARRWVCRRYRFH